MAGSARRAAVGWVAALTLLARPASAQVPGDAIMFRGNPAHTGVAAGQLFSGQGGVRWRVQTDGAVHSTPAVTATRVFAGSADHHLYAIDRASGRVIWRFDAGSEVYASPAVASGLVIAATLGGRIFAVDERTGGIRWTRQTGAALPLNGTRAAGWDLFVSSPTVVGPTILIGGRDGYVYALDRRSGRERWRAKTNGRVRATPAVADGAVIVGSWDGRVYSLDLATGAERWVHKTEGDTLDSNQWGFDRRAIQSSAAIADGMVFVGSRDGALYGLDAATGQRRWRLSHRGSWVLGSPAVRDGRVYVGSSDGHFVQAVDARSGTEIWRRPTTRNALSSPQLAGDALLVGTTAGELLALDAGSGEVRWRLQLDAALNSSPVFAGSEIYVGTDGGDIVAIHEVVPAPARLAVFYDSALARQAGAQGARLAYEYFRQLGYEALDSDSLRAFLAARIADAAPSAVVFAMDVVPKSVAATPGDTTLFRRYLDAGGKVVWLGEPIAAFVRDSAGQPIDLKLERTEQLIGVPSASLDFDQLPAYPTDAGRRWGIDRWLRGDFEWAPAAVGEVLATNELGLASVWVRTYRPERRGSGFVQLWGAGATADRLPIIRAVAEYGLTR
jgi:outer membrane protein assembly factor BamB